MLLCYIPLNWYVFGVVESLTRPFRLDVLRDSPHVVLITMWPWSTFMCDFMWTYGFSSMVDHCQYMTLRGLMIVIDEVVT